MEEKAEAQKDFMALARQMVEQGLLLRNELDETSDHVLKFTNFPSKKDINEIYLAIYETKRDLRAARKRVTELEKQLAMQKASNPGECGPILADASFQAENTGLREETKMIEERTSFTVGEEATLTKTISDEDIKTFARISGDDNPVHVNDDYAKGTMFGGRIAHGMLVASLISAVLGTKLPGPGAIYMNQQLRFLAPVRPGDKVTARAQVTEWDATKGRVTLLTEVINQTGKPVISGEARLVMSSFLAKK